jgi:hypothetical protein
MAQPKEALAVKTKRINIDPNYDVSEQNVKINAGDSIEFFSQANQNCSTAFNPSGLFGNQTVPANGSAPALSTAANQAAITVDYVVVEPDGVTKTGPYSVTVDDGPLNMTVDSDGNCSPADAAIPNNGTLFFTYNQTGPNPPATIVVNFDTPNGQVEFYDGSNPVTSQTLNPGNNDVLAGRGIATATYWFPNTGEEGRVGSGTGTIKVGNT